MLTSPLYAQKASVKPDALVVQEREVSAQLTQAGKESLRSHSSEGQKASGKPDALFPSEQGNLIRRSVFRNANPSNLRGSLLEGNKDHLLNQARSDLAKQELHVESLNKCIGALQRQTEGQRLALQDAQYGFVESRREQVRLREVLSMKENFLRNTQIRNMHEIGEIKRAHFPICNMCKNRWILWMILEIFKMWNQKFVEGLSHVSSQPLMIPSSRALLSRDKRLPFDTWNQSRLQENVAWKSISTFDSPRDHPQRFQFDDVHRNRKAAPEAERTKTIHTSEDRLNQGPMPTFATRPLIDNEFCNAGGITAELHGRAAKTANIGLAIRQTP